MSLRIRRARLESDGTELMELLRRHLSPGADSRRFEWLYCACPHGAARAWLACESQTGAAVGAAAAFPRKMYFDGVERMGWVLGDFCFEERYRSLGLLCNCSACVSKPRAKLRLSFATTFPA